jgi:hypothetical protein
VNLDEIKDPMERQSVEMQILDFGQCPAQLLKKPHRPRMTLEELAKPSSMFQEGEGGRGGERGREGGRG